MFFRSLTARFQVANGFNDVTFADDSISKVIYSALLFDIMMAVISCACFSCFRQPVMQATAPIDRCSVVLLDWTLLCTGALMTV